MAVNQYIPGTCNIGKDEVRVRRNNAILFGIISIVLATALLLLDANKLWRLTLIIPLTVFANGIQQWYFKFCVFFGLKGLFNFEDQGTTFTVEQEEMRKLDLAKARRMILRAFLFGLTLTIGFYLLP